MGGPQGGMRNMDPEQSAQRQLDRLKENIKDLSQVQQDSIKAYYLAQAKVQQAEREKMMQQMQNGGGQGGFDREAMQKQMQERRDAEAKKMKSILTEKQYKTYEKLQSQRGQGGPGMGGPGGGMGGPQGGFGGQGGPQGGFGGGQF